MINYEEARVKLTNSWVNKPKSAATKKQRNNVENN